ncbi:hypothetical protein GF373_01460, partial [bacterium]|nr:hypothetical protein [bacterium]
MSHRFKMSIVMAVVTSLIIFLTSLLLITIVREKRVSDLADYTVHLSYQICQNEKIQQFLKEEISVTHKEDVQQILHGYIENDPFVNELTFIDRFGKIPIQVIGPEQEYQASHYRAVLSINDILHKGEPYLDEKSWEYFLPVQISETTQWGVLRVRWKPEATWKFFRLLKQGVVYTTGGSFLFIVLLAYSVFLRSYRMEFSRMMKILSYVMGGDYSKRFDSQSYSSDLAEIATYFNRIMMDVEEEKKKNAIIDETLRQVER